MPANLPTHKELVERNRASVAAKLPTVDPTIFGSYVRALADSQAGRSFDVVQTLRQLLLEFFPQTSTGEFLERWAGYEGLSRNAATTATGNITFTGTAASVVPAGTSLTSADGNTYTTDTGLTLAAQSISITLTRSGSTATATTVSDHSLATGMSVTVAGANEAEYNGTFTITVTSTTTFTYTVTGTPASPATGTITAAYDGGSVAITSDDAGIDLNLESGAQLSLASPIAGVDTTAYVQYTEVGGGADEETDPALLIRVLQSRSNPVANFNVASIEKLVLAISGVTRVQVNRITPAVGQVTVLFMRDNDINPIPSSGEVATVRTALEAILPAQSDTSDLFVTAPTPVATNYTFSSITPDTTSMRAAIEANLAAFYTDEVDFETDITEDQYRAAIQNTIDTETGDTVTAFTLSAPSGTISITTDEIGTLGTVTF